jgi:hyperosmotically inducible protein
MKGLATIAIAAALVVPAAFAQNDGAQTAAQKALNGSRFKGIQVSVENGVATLTGSTDLLADKLAAEQKVRHVKGVQAIRDEVQVNGPEMSDQQLTEKVGKAINSELWGNVPIAFQAIGVQAHNGVVVLSGHAAGPIAASDAVAVAENTKGVKDVINDIQVDPTSNMDDEIRVREFRAIYGFPSLNKYAIDPMKPIRIQVANGHVTLYGTVDNQADKNAAGIQANGVPGVFSVTNDLQVANAQNETPSH